MGLLTTGHLLQAFSFWPPMTDKYSPRTFLPLSSCPFLHHMPRKGKCLPLESYQSAGQRCNKVCVEGSSSPGSGASWR